MSGSKRIQLSSAAYKKQKQNKTKILVPLENRIKILITQNNIFDQVYLNIINYSYFFVCIYSINLYFIVIDCILHTKIHVCH